jgi:hypothetical protein
MDSLWTAVATTMFQRLKVLKNLLGLYLNRRQAKALLEQVQASDLSAEARERALIRASATLVYPLRASRRGWQIN